MRSLAKQVPHPFDKVAPQQLGVFVHIIYFTHQKSMATWLFTSLDSYDDISSTTCVSSTDEYLKAARALRSFSVLIGQLRARDYCDAEQILKSEGITPHRRVISAPILTPEFLHWASENKFDAVIDVSQLNANLGEHVHTTFIAPQVEGDTSFPTAGGSIICRDSLDEAIVQMVAIGFTNVEIAERFNFALQTIRNRISRIMDESGARNRTHLAAMYIIPHALNLHAPDAPIKTPADAPESLNML